MLGHNISEATVHGVTQKVILKISERVLYSLQRPKK